jgi:ATP-dependent RNA helicase RhlB
LAPTRELAIQIHKDALLLGKYLNFNMALIYGGTDYQKQQKIVQGNVDIMIATPGRLIDFYRKKDFSLDNIQVMVLDEADRMSVSDLESAYTDHTLRHSSHAR